MEERAERDRDEWHALVDGRRADVARSEVDERLDPLLDRVGVGGGEHSLRLVDPDHADARLGDGDRDPTRPDRELDHRAARGERLLDVELDVLDHRDAPVVVETGNRVVQGLAGWSHSVRYIGIGP